MKIAFTAASNPLAQKACAVLVKKYGNSRIGAADYIVALGGDGQVLKALYDVMPQDKPIFAMRRTESIGFLCNEFRIDGLEKRLTRAQKVVLHPLLLEARAEGGRKKTALAINEVTIIRETGQSARLKISVDGITRISSFSGDGILVATPAGSTAYNHSCGGPIMPLDANTLVITAISGFRPRRWSHAVLPQDCVIEIEALETKKRPVRIEAGAQVIRGATYAKIKFDRKKKLTLLFDPEEHLGERIVREQFML